MSSGGDVSQGLGIQILFAAIPTLIDGNTLDG